MAQSSWMRRVLLIGAVGVGITVAGCTIHTTTSRPGYYAHGTVVYQAPPPPRARVVVSARPVAPYQGAVWVNGHWQWNGAQYVWVDGHYIQSRVGYTYVQPRWERRGRGHVYVQGTWQPAQGQVRVQTRAAPPPRRHQTTVRVQSQPQPVQTQGTVRVRVR